MPIANYVGTRLMSSSAQAHNVQVSSYRFTPCPFPFIIYTYSLLASLFPNVTDLLDTTCVTDLANLRLRGNPEATVLREAYRTPV